MQNPACPCNARKRRTPACLTGLRRATACGCAVDPGVPAAARSLPGACRRDADRGAAASWAGGCVHQLPTTWHQTLRVWGRETACKPVIVPTRPEYKAKDASTDNTHEPGSKAAGGGYVHVWAVRRAPPRQLGPRARPQPLSIPLYFVLVVQKRACGPNRAPGCDR